MGLLDYIFGNKEQERLRLEEARHQYVQQRIRNGSSPNCVGKFI